MIFDEFPVTRDRRHHQSRSRRPSCEVRPYAQELEGRCLLATLSTLASFDGVNGSAPVGPLLNFGTELVGTASEGGAYGLGTIYDRTLHIRPPGMPPPAANVASFNGTDGALPTDGLVYNGRGGYDGMTQYGGFYGLGTVFELTPGVGGINTIAVFQGANGAFPKGGVVLDASRNIYGTTEGGGAFGYGTVFEITADTHTLITLASFNYADGADPQGVILVNGNLYGTTEAGGAFSAGTIFELANGQLTTLASLNPATTGFNPLNLTSDGQGNLYGVTQNGGAYGVGTIFELTAAGQLKTLATFDGANGATPSGPLLLLGGNLYGTTAYGGADNAGTVFEWSGQLTTLVSFDGTDGANPSGGLITTFSVPSTLFGTTRSGGANGLGTIFSLQIIP
jgi:uncharacterized repeat protein (TIGR03803 family)